MSERTWPRSGEMAFVAFVTVVLLCLVAAETRRGAAGAPGIVVYAFAAGFGLEFLSAAWRGLWAPPGAERHPQR